VLAFFSFPGQSNEAAFTTTGDSNTKADGAADGTLNDSTHDVGSTTSLLDNALTKRTVCFLLVILLFMQLWLLFHHSSSWFLKVLGSPYVLSSVVVHLSFFVFNSELWVP
jgi:hypothetical protein